MKQIKAIYLLATMVLLASCTASSDTQVTLYGDAAITAFSLGTMNRYVDNVKSTYAGSTYRFDIDPIKHEISNRDSLPVGTDIKHVIVNLSSLNNGQVMIEHDEKGDTLDFYVSTDSIDFSRFPERGNMRYFRVYASNGSGYTRYAVKINVHKQNGDLFVWKKMPTVDHFKGMRGMKAIYFGGKICVFGQVDGQTKGYSTADGGATWNAMNMPTGNCDEDAWCSVTNNADSVYILDRSTVYHTKDLATWTADHSVLPEGFVLDQLVGASTEEIYGITTGGLLVARYTDYNWWYLEERDKEGILPEEYATSVTYPMNMSDSTDMVVMAGNIEIPLHGENVWRTAVWRKIFDYSVTGAISHFLQTGDFGGRWTYIGNSGYNNFLLPAMESLQIVRYDGTLIALGGDVLDENIGGVACSAVYKSRDNGITWIEDDNYAMPPTDSATKEMFDTDVNAIAAVVDDEHYLWVICSGTGEVWRGRMNRLGW